MGLLKALLYEGKELLAGLGLFLMNSRISEETSLEIIANLTTIGMFILVGYGVIKLLVNLIMVGLFGRPFQVESGLIDYLFGFLSVNRVQKIIYEKEDSEKELKQKRKVRSIAGRCLTVVEKIKLALTSFLRNKYSYTAVALVGAGALVSVDVFLIHQGIGGVDVLNFLSENVEHLEAFGLAGVVGSAGVFYKAIVGAGFETEGESEARKEEVALSAEIAAEEKIKQAEIAALEKSVANVIKNAAKFGANPIVFAENFGAGAQVVEAIKKKIQEGF